MGGSMWHFSTRSSAACPNQGYGLNGDEIYSLLLDARAAGHRVLGLGAPWAQERWRERDGNSVSMIALQSEDFLNMIRLVWV